MHTYIATVNYFDEFRNDMEKDTVVVQALSYSEAVAAIEISFKSSIESIESITDISDMAIIHLGNGPLVDQVVELLCQENSF